MSKHGVGVQLLRNVKDGSRVLVEVGCHTGGTSPRWTGPFEDKLYVQHHKGEPVGVALRGRNVGEFDPRQSAEGEPGDVEFHGEEYILRILEIEGAKVADSAQSASKTEQVREELAAVSTAAAMFRMRG